MNSDRRITYLALLLAGFAAVLSIASLVTLRRAAEKFQQEKDRRLELEARLAALDKKTDDVQAATLQELAARLEDICAALKIDCGGEEGGVELPTVPDELLGRIGAPKKSGDTIEVAVPTDLTAAVLGNIDVLKGELSVELAARNNRPDGFRLTELREGGLGLRLGFQVGDVIHAVNGMPFTTTDEVVRVFESLEDGRAASITFDIRRGTQDLRIVVQDPKRQPIIAPVP